MSRPCSSRRIAGRPGATCFKPQGIPACELEELALSLDEFEALRLADLDGLYQAEAAERMGVSRATFARIVEAARRKVADALVHGKSLRIEGGTVRLAEHRCCRLHDAPDADGLAARSSVTATATVESVGGAGSTAHGALGARSPRRQSPQGGEP